MEGQTVTDETVKGRPWWRMCPESEFSTRISEMASDQVVALGNEIAAAIVRTNAVVSDTTVDAYLRKRARTALSHMVSRKHLLKSYLIREHEKLRHAKTERVGQAVDAHEARQVARQLLLSQARAAFDAGNDREALGCILDILERK